MIVLDANVFLRWLTQPVTARDARRAEAARDLFVMLEDGGERAFASEAVLAEVAFVLTSRRHYGVARADAATALLRLVRLPSLDVPDKPTVLESFRLWADHPVLDFPDALVVAHARARGARLASFDADVRVIANVPLWGPG